MSRPQSRVSAEIDRLFLLHEGRLTPDMLIEAARPVNSILHSSFPWDKDRAAHEHWRWIARKLISGVTVQVTTTHYKINVPAYVRDPSVPADKQGFVSVALLRTDKQLAEEAVEAECLRAASALARAHAVAAALDLEEELWEVRERVKYLARRASGRDGASHAGTA